MNFFYSRVSTEEQNDARQLEVGSSYDEVFADKASGKNTDRPELKRMLDKLRENDTVTVLSIDRLGRSTNDILNIISRIKSVNAKFICLSPQFNTSDVYGDFFISVLASLSELERKQILERQRQGIRIAKQNGKYKGRKPKKLDDFEEIYSKQVNSMITAEQAAKLLGVSRSTYYRRASKYNKSIDNK